MFKHIILKKKKRKKKKQTNKTTTTTTTTKIAQNFTSLIAMGERGRRRRISCHCTY
jgi:hypothetical protein